MSYNLGKQALDDLHVITSDNTVNDDTWHTILFARYVGWISLSFEMATLPQLMANTCYQNCNYTPIIYFQREKERHTHN